MRILFVEDDPILGDGMKAIIIKKVRDIGYIFRTRMIKHSYLSFSQSKIQSIV